MGEEETVAAETVEHVTCSPEKTSEAAKAQVENDEAKEIDEDKRDGEKIETPIMDVDPVVKVDEESTQEEEKEENDKKDDEKMDVDPDVKVDEKIHQEEGNDEEITMEVVKEESGSKEEVSKEEVGEEVDEVEEGKLEEKVSKRRRKRNTGVEKVYEKTEDTKRKVELEPVTPTTDRPVRERKSVERLVASIDKDTVKELKIEKGRGTPLKDIPNVIFKLNKKKNEDTIKMLHMIVFGRRGKAIQFKSNISRFSGFVWHDNEEKQKSKVREKIDKFVKEKLLEFCDVLDIPIAKNTTRKEDIVTKLLDFLAAPHATTTELLSEKEKSNTGTGTGTGTGKRKRVAKGSSSTSASTLKPSGKMRRKDGDTSKSKEEKDPADTEDEAEKDEGKEGDEEETPHKENENGIAEKSEYEIPEPSLSEEKTPSRKKGTSGKTKSKKITVLNKSKTPSSRTPKKPSSRNAKADIDNEVSPKVFSRKKKDEKASKEKLPIPVKAPPKEKSGKKTVKGKDKKKEEKVRLTDDELRNAIVEILKEVDFNTATFSDILKQLVQQFDMDLTPRKSSIKLMIQDELTKLASEADDDEDEKDETHSGGQEVEA